MAKKVLILSWQLKAVYDRMVARYEVIHDKELYYIMTATEAYEMGKTV